MGRILIATAVCMTSAGTRAEHGDEASLRQAITEANQAIQAEFLKVFAAKKAVLEGIAAYRAEARIQEKATTLQRDMVQSGQLCQAMDSADALAAGQTKARARTQADQHRSVDLMRNLNTTATLDTKHRASNERFCSSEEAEIGVCKATTRTQYSNLAGADQNALYLFQSQSGGDTYEGTKDSGQVEAVNAYIARVVSGSLPPEMLRAVGADGYSQNPKARAYAELARRYQAFLSMSAYSLNSIKGTRTPAQ